MPRHHYQTHQFSPGRTNFSTYGRMDNWFVQARRPFFETLQYQNNLVYEYGYTNQTSDSSQSAQRPQKPDQTDSDVMHVQKVDFNVTANSKVHHTDEYDIVSEPEGRTPPQLVIRRGEKFQITVTFDRSFDRTKDDLRLVFEIGDNPLPSKGTHVELILSDKDKDGEWGAWIKKQSKNNLTVTVITPSSCFIGKWHFRLDVIKKTQDKRIIYRYKHDQPIYILFNPWNHDRVIQVLPDQEIRLVFTMMKFLLGLLEPKSWYSIQNIRQLPLKSITADETTDMKQVPVKLSHKPESQRSEVGDDHVFLSDHMLLNEYVVNDVGKIYVGTSKQISARPWNFGQYEGNVLDCAMYLLDISGLPMSARGNAVNITRKLSAMANAPDDGGILVGNWSGDYTGGKSPLQWSGSIAILEEFYKSKQPVKFGQCWVFSGILTTLCRTLGIPSRSITNFSSAHDCDESISIDVHWNAKRELLEELNNDSIWNFHVWNEAWMARPDLPEGYGGWQAIDATPQETSDGIYCTGPASVIALKNGNVHLPYDGKFVFAEVNADRVHWIMDEEGSMKKSFVEKQTVGRCISTKRPNNMRGELRITSANQDPDREDVTNQYKFTEGSSEERAAVRQANMMGSTLEDLYETKKEDVTFELIEKEEVEMGEDFDTVIKLTNNSTENRTVSGTLAAATMYYTGVPGSMVKSEKLDSCIIKPKETKEVKMSVKVDQYLDKLVDHCNMKISSMFLVAETGQVFVESDGFRLRKPHLTLKAPTKAKVGKMFTTEVSFTNPLPTALTSCLLEVEGPGLQKPTKLSQGIVPPKQTVVSSIELTPVKKGERKILVTFNCKQIEGITGYCTVNVN